jgi:diguanylate cyclase (GGDEF)-like protein
VIGGLTRWWRRSRPAVSVGWLTLTWLLVTLGCWFLLGGHRQPLPRPRPAVPWWALAVMFALAQSFVLNIQLRREARSVFLSEIPMLLGLLYLPGQTLVVARLLGAAAGFGLLRRQYRQPQKLLFNATLAAAEAAVASVGYLTAAVVSGTSRPALWLAGVVATAVSSGFAAVGVGAVIHLLESSLRPVELARLGGSSVLQALPIASMGVVVAAAWDDSPWSAVPLLCTCALLLFAYRAYAGLNERHLSLERLYRFTQIVSSTPEVDGILRSVLAQARELLHADRARLTFLHDLPQPQGVEVSLTGEGDLRRGPSVYVPPQSWITELIVSEARPVLIPRSTRVPRERDWLLECALRDSLMVPLPGESGPVAILGVDDRLGDARGFDKADVRLLETVANHAAIALRNGQLVDQLRHESLHDPLTGLPNRTFFQRELERQLGDPASADFAVGILDLDDFKDVNDTLGHQQGDLLLEDVAARLTAAAGQAALIARLGGDEFAILHLDCASAQAAERFGRHLLDALQKPIYVEGIEITVRASLGMALAPQHASNSANLLKCADLAMYEAKQTARGVRLYDDTLDNTSSARLGLVAQLRRAIEAGAINAYIQPQASLLTGHLAGAEALCRWRHPERGTVSPDEFIPLAERSGLIGPLTTLVLTRAVAACAGWQHIAPGVGVSVNISARSLDDGQLPVLVADTLSRYALPPELLTLEITESSIMADPAGTRGVLELLRAQGTNLSVDDFGTGYSSLSYLRRLPVTEVKIDKSFVQRMADSADDAAIVKSIVDLGHSLKLTIVAEGVEDEPTWRQLASMGCDTAQGYLIARPLPLHDITAWLTTYQTPVPTQRNPAVNHRPASNRAAAARQGHPLGR